MRGLWIGALFSVLLGGCVGSESVTCDDGSVCPSTLTCAPNGGCASLIQIAGCESRADGDSCSTGAGQGFCNFGICVGSQCGNGVLDEGESCDTGIALSEGECRSDCRAVEVCGNGVVEGAEQCDDKNQNDADGCSTECVRGEWSGTTLYGAGLLAADVSLRTPSGVFVNGDGNLFVADRGGGRILRVDALTSVTTVVAGTGSNVLSGDIVSASEERLAQPKGVFVDGLGDIYIADRGTERILRVDSATGLISTVAGGGEFSGGEADGRAATDAKFNGAYAVFVMGNGDFYIAEAGHRLEDGDVGDARVRLVDAATGVITTVAGGGDLAPDDADGGAAASAKLENVSSVYVVGVGDDAELYIAEREAGRVRHVDSDGVITTVAGGGDLAPDDADGGLATLARLSDPVGVAVVGEGPDADLYISERFSRRIRHVNSGGIITTVAGGGDLGSDAADGGLATSASLSELSGIAVVGSGENIKIYFSERDGNRVRLVDSSGIITTVVGGQSGGGPNQGGLATSVSLKNPVGISVVGSGADAELYIADSGNSLIRHVDSSGIITTVAGGGDIAPADADGVLATNASLRFPNGLFVIATGTGAEIYIADTNNSLIRRVDSSGIITTVAGGGEIAPADADGVLATTARLNRPHGIFVVGSGADAELYIADSFHDLIRHVDSSGIITTVAGGGSIAPADADGVLATDARLYFPDGISAVGTGSDTELYIVDRFNRLIRHVDSSGIITTVAGGGSIASADSDGVLATDAMLGIPRGISVVGAGADAEFYIADTTSSSIRYVNVDGIISTIVGTGASGVSGDGGLAKAAQLRQPLDIFLAGTGADAELYIADTSNNRIRRVDSSGNISTVAGQTYSVTRGLLATEGVGNGIGPTERCCARRQLASRRGQLGDGARSRPSKPILGSIGWEVSAKRGGSRFCSSSRRRLRLGIWRCL